MNANSLSNQLFLSEESFSLSDTEMSRIQDAILKESKDIEKFIKDSNQDEQTASLTVLKSLFELFKSELSINITLRQYKN